MNLERLIPFYRRDSDEPTGAVRISAVTTIAAEQMPGGRAQISARTLAGEQQFLSPQLPHYRDAIDMLEKFRKFCGGEINDNPAEEWLAARAEEERLEKEALLAEEARQRALLESATPVEPVWSPPREAVPV